ncbi:MAG: hypothetical protein UMV23_02395, partial [Halanaerobium sp.]|nr:hypothetical protein [Halanaerobium sp.]
LCFSDKYQRVKGTFVKEIDRMITCNLSMEGFKQGQPLSFIWTTVNRTIIYTSHYLFTRNSTRAEITNKIYLYENFLLPENKLRMEVHYRGRQIAEKEIRLVEQGIYGKDGSFQ